MVSGIGVDRAEKKLRSVIAAQESSLCPFFLLSLFSTKGEPKERRFDMPTSRVGQFSGDWTRHWLFKIRRCFRKSHHHSSLAHHYWSLCSSKLPFHRRRFRVHPAQRKNGKSRCPRFADSLADDAARGWREF